MNGKQKDQTPRLWLSGGTCIVIGLLLSLLLRNVKIGLAIGLALGLLSGSLLSRRRPKS